MDSSNLHRWWRWGCLVAVLLSGWAGGFSVPVIAVFIGIYLTGVALIGPEEPEEPAAPAAPADPEEECSPD